MQPGCTGVCVHEMSQLVYEAGCWCAPATVAETMTQPNIQSFCLAFRTCQGSVLCLGPERLYLICSLRHVWLCRLLTPSSVGFAPGSQRYLHHCSSFHASPRWLLALCSSHYAAVCADHGVLLGAGVSVLGPIHVGAGAKVGAGSVVVTDLPNHSVAVGVPARIIRYNCPREPSMDMDAVADFKHDYQI